MKYVWLGFVVAIAFYSNFNAVHRFNEDKYEWNYDGRSGFATKFHFTSD
ncbi:MAG: hypothetical protein HY607_10025 [Planctomycetes bacterium]|nr:hypothetical protein [Planctomycetota bacterium]MBI4223004.1 hypothetical protein [Planctomycetota bacterium]